MTRPPARPGPDPDEAARRRPGAGGAVGAVGALLLTAALSLAHGWAVWLALEGSAGLNNGWPLWRDDHPLYFHSALVTREFLRLSGTTAGYDPAFMSGYAKSVVFPASSTLPELVVAAFGGSAPERAYKLYVLASAALIPWLVAASAAAWRVGPGGILGSVALFLLYVWTDFPINYAAFGMLPYLLGVPLGLLATAAFGRWTETAGVGWWLGSAVLLPACVLVHLTTPLVVAPAAAVAAVGGWAHDRRRGVVWPPRRWAALLVLPAWVLAVNAFWWYPGLPLAGTKGLSGFAFAHPEGAWVRLRQIATTEAPVERVLVVAGLLGAACALSRGGPRRGGLVTFALAGFGWGYLAGEFRALDFLQPGRHTYAFFTALSVLAGLGFAEGLRRLRARFRWRLDRLVLGAVVAGGVWAFGPNLDRSVRGRVAVPVPFLSSRPSPRLLWVVSRVKRHVGRGERLLYEEGGFGIPGVPDPFQGGRFSGLLADRLGIELIGGPYLHASLTTNFTQFGEGTLFGRSDWGRDWFVRYARLYRPSAVLCWSPRARAFCLSNPDLVEVKDDDGVLLVGRVIGFEGAAVRGRAEVEASPGRLRVRGASADLDGTVVLRYHSVPCLRSDPPVAWDSVLLEGDPVPFLRLRPPPGAGAVTFDLRFFPSRGSLRAAGD